MNQEVFYDDDTQVMVSSLPGGPHIYCHDREASVMQQNLLFVVT